MIMTGLMGMKGIVAGLAIVGSLGVFGVSQAKADYVIVRQTAPVYAAPVIVRQAPVVYTPAPVYYQPVPVVAAPPVCAPVILPRRDWRHERFEREHRGHRDGFFFGIHF